MLQGGRLLQCHLCVQEAQEPQGLHPCPSCRPVQALLCTLDLGVLSVQGIPWLLLALLGRAPQGALGFGDRNLHPQVAQVHLCNLEDPWVLFYLEIQVNPSLQVAQEGHGALAALGTPLVLSGHHVHHILEHLGTPEGLAGQGVLAALAYHSHLALLSEDPHSQGGLQAQVLLLGHQDQEVPDLQEDLGQECHP